MPKKKLIEVALPLDAINAQSAREKSIRHGHPSTLHLWWARRPLATARAVLFSQLVDDPSAHEEQYRSEAEQSGVVDIDAAVQARILAERERLFDLITRMVDWDNLGDEALFDEVRAEILKSTDGHPPAILDPFAGGGTIPLEAQRLGLEARASDLNPVAVLINKALIEFPPKFAGLAPVFPNAVGQRNGWPGPTGLAEDVRRYGVWMRDEAERRIGHLYPKVVLDDGSQLTVIASIWARTVKCPNPACGIEMPLVRSWWLGKKRGREAYIVPTVVGDHLEYTVSHDVTGAPRPPEQHVMSGRSGTTCIRCGLNISVADVRAAGEAGTMGQVLLATVAAGKRSRQYLSPTAIQVLASKVDAPAGVPEGEIADNPRWFSPPSYGLTRFSDLFTNRQLVALTTFSDLVSEVRSRVAEDARNAGLAEGNALEAGGAGAAAYADAIATYLGLAVSRTTDLNNSLATWSSSRDQTRNLFARQAMPMAWDFVEVSPFADAAGDLGVATASISSALLRLDGHAAAHVQQLNAAEAAFKGAVVSTDPPYYDNIGYSDLSDFFYVWLRRSLRAVHPRLLSTLLVPKAEELVANPYRNGGAAGARNFFEKGFDDVFAAARVGATEDFPITVYYAFKQSESDDLGDVSAGWQTILSGIVSAGWTVTATWPMRSERGGRMVSIGTNALASSIVLALRPRPVDASVIDRRGFVSELRAVLPTALRDLQLGSVAPVDLAQASIGPGMAVYSKYAEVIEPNGAKMPVRAALQQVNAILDEVLSAQEGDFDAATRWCLAWFEGRGFGEGPYGEAELLASAKGASVEGIRRSGVLISRAGKVALLSPEGLPSDYDPRSDDRVTLWEIVMHLAREMGAGGGGVEGAGALLVRAEERGVDTAAAHELAYLLYSLCERKGWVAPGILFNALGGSWPEIKAAARALPSHFETGDQQLAFDLAEEA